MREKEKKPTIRYSSWTFLWVLELVISCYFMFGTYLITCCALCFLNTDSNRADITRSAIFQLEPLLKMPLAQI